MTWIWQLEDWPNFEYNVAQTETLEREFLINSGSLFTVISCLDTTEQNVLRIHLLSDEAIQTSKIENEFLDRASVQSSLKRHFGLSPDKLTVAPAEQGISELLIDLYQHYELNLSPSRLRQWHKALLQGRRDIQVGCYRAGADPMQIISGKLHDLRVHYEAPPSAQVKPEMKRFIDWFNTSKNSTPALVRASLAHLYFECIHPFEDGNGRIGRALSELSLSQSLGQAHLPSLSRAIENDKKRYYSELAKASKTLHVDEWLKYFAQVICDAQQISLAEGKFIIQKTQFLDRFRGQLNARQEKALIRIFREGVNGFQGGLSASNYINITKTTRATATRDLSDLVEKGALIKTGELKHTRYFLNLEI